MKTMLRLHTWLLVALLLVTHSVAAEARLEQGLSLHLPLTHDLKDHSPARHPIEVIGKISLDPEGAFFGGRKDWLEAPHIPLANRPFSIAVWIRAKSDSPTIGLLEQFDLNRPSHHFHLLLKDNRRPYLGFYSGDLMSPLPLAEGPIWNHLVFQYSGKEQQIWINGRFIASRETTAYLGGSGKTAIGKIPRWRNVPGKDFTGWMRDFRIYDRALSNAEIALLAAVSLEDPRIAAINPPPLDDEDRKIRGRLAERLSADHARPFLQITDQKIVIHGHPGEIYQLQTTIDFQKWTPLLEVTNQNGILIHQSSGKDFGPMQFFRVQHDK